MRAFYDKKEGHVHVPEVEGEKISPEQLKHIQPASNARLHRRL